MDLRTRFYLLPLAILGALTLSSGDRLRGEDLSPEALEFFEKEVRPVLVRHCYRCHSEESNRVRGGLLLDTQEGWMDGGDSGAALEPGDPNASLLIRAIRYEDEDLQMPPKGKMSDKEIAALVQWVQSGAPDPRVADGAKREAKEIDLESGRRFWAFQLPEKSAPPEVRKADWPRDELDHYVLAGLEANRLEPVADADRRDFLRRLTFDLTGLPPTTAEIHAFLADESPTARETVVDRLLDSARFGERWGRHWLDIARYAESTGRTRNVPFRYAWRYRDYVIGALNADKPYDEFLREQIAGDLLPAESNDERNEHSVATGFLALGTKDLNERNTRQFLADNVDEQIDTLSRGVLALTVGCARCHDHKFDPIPTADYYALAGIFGSTEILAGLTGRGGGRKNYENRDLLIALETDGTNLEPSAESAPETKPNAKPNRGLRRRIARVERELREERAKMASATREEKRRLRPRIQQLNRQLNNLKRQSADDTPPIPVGAPLALGVRERDRPVNARIYIRGEVSNPGDVVERGFLRVLAVDGAKEVNAKASGRLELANWIASDSNPLTARVFVNRVWHHLFGRGLVRTVDNFGSTGAEPSHPELLDALAVRFVEGGWSVKRLIRTIVLSRTYGLSTDHHDANYEADPDNVRRWRMSPRRIEVEAFRDAMLAVSGTLEVEPPSGSPVERLRSAELGRRGGPIDLWSDLRHRRSVYIPVVRGMVPPMFEIFDFAEPTLVKGNRDITTVPTQALFLLNNPYVRELAASAAKRVLAAEGLDTRGRVRHAYELAFARLPSPAEEARALAYLKSEDTAADEATREDWTRFSHALFASAEFRYLN